jgi:inhibitor of cysteine peptidase
MVDSPWRRLMHATTLPVKAPVRPATLLVSLAVIAVLVVAALALAQGGEAAPGLVSLGAGESGAVVGLALGSELAISLPANPTTGYSWAVLSIDPGILTQIGEAEFIPQSDLVGAAGSMTLRFEASAAGETELELGYLRPWEDAEPIDSYRITVQVH